MLPKRMAQVLDILVKTGASNREIAKQMNISANTVKMHITKLTRKAERLAGKKHFNRTQVVLFFLKNGIDNDKKVC